MKPFRDSQSPEIDAYLDGLLTDQERDEFLREMGAGGQLQAEIELQSQIDASLAQVFAAPQVPEHLLQQLRESATAAQLTSHDRRRWLKTAALVAAATIVWATFGWYFFANRTEWRHYNPNLPLETIYEKCVADGFRPKWICEDKHEFASTFLARQGQALLLADMPPGTKMEGLTYCGGISRYTTTMLARIDGSPVMVFIDRASADTHPTLPPRELTLHLFRKLLGTLVIYELTPLNEP